MKKVLKIVGFIFVAIFLLLLILPLTLKGKIETIVKEEGNKMLNAQFDFKSLDISLISQFPSASVTLEDFWLKGVGEFENDTFIQIKLNISITIKWAEIVHYSIVRPYFWEKM